MPLDAGIKPPSACSKLSMRHDLSTSKNSGRDALAPHSSQRESNGVSANKFHTCISPPMLYLIHAAYLCTQGKHSQNQS